MTEQPPRPRTPPQGQYQQPQSQQYQGQQQPQQQPQQYSQQPPIGAQGTGSTSDAARQRANYARQVISGSQLQAGGASVAPVAAVDGKSLGQDQLMYFVILAFLLILGLVLYLIFGFGVASIIFLLLAFALFAGYFLF